jgi:hypothetical protein
MPCSSRSALKGTFCYFAWDFRSETDYVCMEGTITAQRDAFVGLNYCNPPGGNKHYLNGKIASCALKLTRKDVGKFSAIEILSTIRRAAFELLTDARDHGLEIRA